MKNLMFAALPAAALFVHVHPAQAQSASAQMCMAWVYDGNDKQRIFLFSDIFDFRSVPDVEQAWRTYLSSSVKKALDQFGERGRLEVQCSDKPVTYSKMAGIKANLMEVGQYKGLLVDTVRFPSAHLTQKEGGSNASGSASEGGDAGDENASASDKANGADASAGNVGKARKDEEALRHVAVASGPPPAGYSDWKRHYNNNRVVVEYAYRASPSEVRVIWRCTNESNKDASCSVGAGAKVEYQCWNGNSSLGSSFMPGQRSTVRAGKTYSFPSDWACRDVKGATSVVPVARISIER